MKVECPSCQATVEIEEGEEPSCPECGFEGGRVEDPEPQEPEGPKPSDAEDAPSEEPAATQQDPEPPGPRPGASGEAGEAPLLRGDPGPLSEGRDLLTQGEGQLTDGGGLSRAPGSDGSRPSGAGSAGQEGEPSASGPTSVHEARQGVDSGPAQEEGPAIASPPPSVDLDELAPFEAYLRTVENRLRERDYNRVSGGPAGYEATVFHRRTFEITKFGVPDYFVVVAHFEDPTPQAVQAFSQACLEYGLSNKSMLPRGLGGMALVFPVVVTGQHTAALSQWVRSYAPKHWAANQFPIVVDLSTPGLDYKVDTPFWGAAYYKGFRDLAQECLAPPVELADDDAVEGAADERTEQAQADPPSSGPSRPETSTPQGQAPSSPPSQRPVQGQPAQPAQPAGVQPGGAPHGQAGATGQHWAPHAGFWKRFFAFLIDAVLLALITVPAFVIVGGLVAASLAAGEPGTWTAEDVQSALVLAGTGLVWLYFAGFEGSSWQATPGKKALGLQVTDERGHRLTFGRATGRHFAKFLSLVILYIGFLMIGFTENKQGLHDKVASCYVVEAGGARAGAGVQAGQGGPR